MEKREEIFDPLRRKRVALTPEERVRQFFINWLNKECHYPLTLMASEYTICYNKQKFRCDIVCFNRALEPQVIVECKSPDVKLTNSVVEQITRYNMVLKVKYLIITNGLNTYICKFDAQSGKYGFVEEFPLFES